MTTQTEALKLALEVMRNNGDVSVDEWIATEKAIKEALAQPELCKYGQEPKSCTSSPMDCQCVIDAALAQPEPVAYVWTNSKGWLTYGEQPHDRFVSKPLYTTPPQRKPLTRKQIDEMADDGDFAGNVYEITRAIEAAHGIKE